MTRLVPCITLYCLSMGGHILAEDFLFNTKSGLKPWVDVHTPKEMYTKQSSRGDTWELVMSDEFNLPGRQFGSGKDHLWTALELPDGVNAALEYYSINMTSTVVDEEDRGVFQIEIRQEENITFTVFNAYTKPPSLETHTMYYRSGMVQSWNKFCFQGGLMEVVAKLPGAVGEESGNPDLLHKSEKHRVENIGFYPTWPGIWLLGNLGRALFTGSTNRMWPWSYDVCDKDLEKDQRISACDSSPGFGLNPNQGRGAPEIDLLEGGGTDISTSIQVAPGMPEKFRLVAPSNDSNIYCTYAKQCETTGANYPGIPTKIYAKRGYKSWYQGLRYTPNSLCFPKKNQIQDMTAVLDSMKKGITSNRCEGVNTCPASGDGYSDLGLMEDGANGSTRHWGINDIGGCMPVLNGYIGSYLCDPDNTDERCGFPLKDGNDRSNVMAPFNYQMDAISANSGLPLASYTSYLSYQLEWVPGPEGYVRWMMEDLPLYEIPADALENPPQDDEESNPKKLMIEEPMYVIFNVALSTSWGTKPPNPGQPCQGDGKDERVNRICDSFPMYLKIDFIRIYQDTSPSSKMQVGCDPNSHPTKKWIEEHIEEYENPTNKVIEVIGGATCTTNEDCTVDIAGAHIVTGTCQQRRCNCHVAAWGGPRCTTALTTGGKSIRGFGPSTDFAFSIGLAIVLATFGVIFFTWYKHRREKMAHRGPEFKKTNNYNEEGGGYSPSVSTTITNSAA